MTDEEIMRQLSQAVRDDDALAAEEMVAVGQQQHPEWDWPLLANSSVVQPVRSRRATCLAATTRAERSWRIIRPLGIALAKLYYREAWM
jgi:hypothetical protein